MHPTIHELALAANPRRERQHHPARLGGRGRRARALVEVGSVVVRLGLRIRAAGAGGAPVRHQSGAPPGSRVAT